MRGDRPWEVDVILVEKGFTPHARGSTYTYITSFQGIGVYPACAGIDRLRGASRRRCPRLPRMRGDRPCCKVSAVLP